MRLLAVDDDPIILDLLESLIGTIEAHELVTASSGSEALELLASADFPAVDGFLVDMQMPGMDGASTVRHIREIRRYRETPIMMLTAVSDKRYIDAAFAAGALDYLTKPVDAVELKARLTRLEAVARPNAQPRKDVAANDPQGPDNLDTDAQSLKFYEPITVYDVPNLIDLRALENYVLQLTRSSLFGSACFALAIRDAQSHFQNLSEFEYRSMIADVAEVISDTLMAQQYLMAYAGNGVFVCVTDSGWLPEMDKLTDSVNLSLARAEIYSNSGQELHVRVAGGKAGRLVWKSGFSLLEALAEANASAEEAAAELERELKNMWSDLSSKVTRAV